MFGQDLAVKHRQYDAIILKIFSSLFCAVTKTEISDGPLDNETWHTNGWLQQKLPKFGFRTHATAIWPMEQSSILSAKFDCPVACENVSLLETAHDCETGLLLEVRQREPGGFSLSTNVS